MVLPAGPDKGDRLSVSDPASMANPLLAVESGKLGYSREIPGSHPLRKTQMSDAPQSSKPEPATPATPPASQPASPPIGPLGVLSSVFRAWFGVQTEERRQRDFSSSDPKPFIIAGIIFAVVMVIGVIMAVNLAISATGS